MTGRANGLVRICFSRATILAAAIEPRITSSVPVYCAENFAHLSLWSSLEEVQLLTCGARCRVLRQGQLLSVQNSTLITIHRYLPTSHHSLDTLQHQNTVLQYPACASPSPSQLSP